MSVHYKFKSTLDYDTITFDGLHISVADLKKAILQQKRLNKIDFDLQIVNAQTKEEYQHENTLIPKNTSLIISRVPLANPGRKQQYWDKQTSNQLLHMQSRKPPPFPLRSLKSEDLDLYKMEGSEEQKIDAMMAQSAGFYDPKSYHKIRPFPQTGEVPITYRCNKCKRGGHWIKNCPYNISKDHGEVKRTTGIPKSFIDKEERNLLIQGKEPLIEEEKKQEIPDDLICSICHDLFIDAVMIPCCGSSFCDDCVRCALLESEENECPDCKEKGCSPESLIPNRFLRKSVNSFKNRTGYKTPLLQKKVQPKDNEVNVKLNKANVPLVRPKDTDEKRDEEPTSNNKKNLVEQNKQITDATVIAVVDAPTVLSASIAAPATAVVPTTIVVPITASSVTLKGKEVDPETARQSEDVEAKTQEKIVDAETKTATPTISDNKKKDTKEEKLKENVPASLIPTAIGNKSNDDVEKGKNKEKDKEKDMLSPNHEESDYEDNIVVTIMPPIDNSPAEKYLHNPHPRHGPHASHLISSPIHKHQIPPYHSDDGGGGVGGVGIGMPGNHKDWDHNIREKYTNEHHENIISENIYLSPERPRALLKAPDIPLQPPGMQHGQLGPLYGPILPHPPYADIHNAQQPRHMGPRPLNMHPGYHNPLHNRAPIYSQHPSMPLHHQVGGLHHSVAPVPRITMPLLNAYEQPYNPIGTLASGYPRYPPPTMMPARFTYAIREVPENITTNYPLRSYTNLTSVYEEVQAKVGVGIIDDPLEAFNRIMKEKEKKKDERRSPERRHRSKERHVRKPFRQSPYNHRIRKDMGHYHYHDKRARSRDHDMERSRWNQYAKDQEREQDRERDRNRKPIPLENDKRERDKDINYRLRRSKSFDKISRSRSHSPKRYRCASPALMTTKNYNANDKHHQQKFRHDEPLVSPVEDVNPDSRYKHGKSSTMRFYNSRDGNRQKYFNTDKIVHVRELTLHQHQHYKHPRKSYDEDSEPPPPGSEFLHSRNPFHGSRNGSDRNLSPSSHLISSEATYCRDNEEDWLNMHNPTPDLYEKCVSGDVEESRTYNVNRQTYSRSPVRRMSHGSMLSSKSRSRSPASSYGNDKRKRYKCSTTPRGGPLQLSSNNNNNHNYNNKKDKGREKEDLERYAGYVANHNVGHKSEDKSSGQRMERKDYHQHQQHQHHKQRSQDDDEDEEVVGREIRERKHSMTPGHGKVDTRTATVSPEMDRDCKSESKKSDKKLKERKKKRKEKKENKKPKKEKKAKKERYKSKSQDKEEPEDDEEEEEEDEELEENESKQQQNDMNKNENNVKKIERTIDSKTKLEVNQMISNKDNMNLITKSKAESDNFDIDKLKTYDQQNDQIIIEKSSRDKEKENIAITNDSTSTQATSATVASTNINDSSTLQYNDQQNHKSNEKKSPLSMSTSTFTANIKSLDAVLDIHEHETDFDGNTFKRQENNVTFNKIVPETSKWEIEEPQPDNLIIISNNVGHNDKIDYSSKSSTVESSVERVTNDIIVRAEKAIFARAINAIRPIETSKKSISQESSTNTKSFGVITGSSSTYHHHHHHHHTESSSDIKNIQITLPLISSGHKERSIELKSTDNFSEQKKKSVKERLGSKVTQQPLISHINDVHKEGGIGGNGNDNDTDNQHCETERYKRSGVSGALDSKIITKRNEFDKNYRSCRNNDHRNYNIQLQQQQLPFHYEKEREREHNKDKQRDKQAESDWQRGKDKNRGEPKNQKSDQSRQRERNRERERDNEREKERDRERDHNRERERDKERNRNRERTHDRDRGRDRDRERSQNLLKSKIIKDNLQSSTASLAHRHPPKTTSERSTATSTTHKRQYESTSPRRKRKSVSDTNTSSDHHSSRDDEDDRDKHKHIKLDRKGHKQQQQTQQQHQEHSDSSDSGDENSKKSKRKNKSSKKKKKSRK